MKGKLNVLFIIAMLMLASLSRAQSGRIFTEGDYRQAVSMLSHNVNQLVDRDISPEWLPDGRLWYKCQTGNQTTYKLVDPGRKRV